MSDGVEELGGRGWRAWARRTWWRGVRPWWRRVEWPVLWAAALAALALGAWGFHRYYTEIRLQPRSLLDELYLSVQLYILQSGALDGELPWQLELARWLAPAVTVYTATKALLVIFREQIDSVRLFLFYRKHSIVCGLGRKGYLLVRSLRAAGRRVVVVESDEQNPRIERCRERGALVIVGNAADRTVLRRARAHKAAWLVTLLPDDGENAEVAGRARTLSARRRGEGLTCLAHIAEPQLCDQLVDRELATAEPGPFRLGFFNVYQSGARALLDAHNPFAGAAAPHLLVVGLGRMGQSVIGQAAGEWRVSGGGAGGLLDVTFIDIEAERKAEALSFSHPQVVDACRLHPLPLDVYSTEFQRGDFLRGGDGRPPVSVAYVCLDQDAAGLYAALKLVRLLRGRGVNIVVRMTHDAGLARLLTGGGAPGGAYAGLRAFKLFEEVCHVGLLPEGRREGPLPESVLDAIARAIHAEYARDRRERGETTRENPSIAPWDALPRALRESNYEQARDVVLKLRQLGYDIERATGEGRAVRSFGDREVDQMAMMEHERWLAEHDGWTLGPKDYEKRTHPHLLPWDRLPEEVRKSNREAVGRIPALLAWVGYQVQKVDGQASS